MMVSNCPRCQIVLGVKLSSLPSWCQIVLLAIMVSNFPRCQIVLRSFRHTGLVKNSLFPFILLHNYPSDLCLSLSCRQRNTIFQVFSKIIAKPFLLGGDSSFNSPFSKFPHNNSASFNLFLTLSRWFSFPIRMSWSPLSSVCMRGHHHCIVILKLKASS